MRLAILLNLLSNACKFTKEGQIVAAVTRPARGQETSSFRSPHLWMSLTSWPAVRGIRPGDATTAASLAERLGLAITRRLCQMMRDVSDQRAARADLVVHLPSVAVRWSTRRGTRSVKRPPSSRTQLLLVIDTTDGATSLSDISQAGFAVITRQRSARLSSQGAPSDRITLNVMMPT